MYISSIIITADLVSWLQIKCSRRNIANQYYPVQKLDRTVDGRMYRFMII